MRADREAVEQSRRGARAQSNRGANLKAGEEASRRIERTSGLLDLVTASAGWQEGLDCLSRVQLDGRRLLDDVPELVVLMPQPLGFVPIETTTLVDNTQRLQLRSSWFFIAPLLIVVIITCRLCSNHCRYRHSSVSCRLQLVRTREVQQDHSAEQWFQRLGGTACLTLLV